MYFFDIKEAKSGKPYLSMTETRYDKGSGQQERSSLLVYPEDMQGFFKIIRMMVKDLMKFDDELDRRPRQQSFVDGQRRTPKKRSVNPDPEEEEDFDDNDF